MLWSKIYWRPAPPVTEGLYPSGQPAIDSLLIQYPLAPQ